MQHVSRRWDHKDLCEQLYKPGKILNPAEQRGSSSQKIHIVSPSVCVCVCQLSYLQLSLTLHIHTFQVKEKQQITSLYISIVFFLCYICLCLLSSCLSLKKGQTVAYNVCIQSLHNITKKLNRHYSSIDVFLENYIFVYPLGSLA